ncbi:MAG: ABC transporter permease [Acidimicrobiia bacterium]
MAEVQAPGLGQALDVSVPTTATAGSDEVVTGPRLGLSGMLAAGWLVLVTGLALLAPVLPLPDPNRFDPDLRYTLPGTPGALLGGDNLGRDVLSRVVWGGRISLLVGVASIAIGLVVGGTLGLVAGFSRSRLARVLVVAFDVLLAIPQVVLALALVAVLAGGDGVSDSRRVVVQIVALGVVAVPLMARITRAATLTWAEREFVTAARAIGTPPSRILRREVLPNVLPAMLAFACLGVAVAVVAEGGLAVLGVGIATRPTWGNMIAQNVNDLARSYHVVFAASTCTFLTVLSLNHLGDHVKRRTDPRRSLL